jgi:D-alanine-D-alanine ligase-like ATP-grasp enzyme
VDYVVRSVGQKRAIGRFLVAAAPVLGAVGAYSSIVRRIRRKLRLNGHRLAESRKEFYFRMWRDAAARVGAHATLLTDGSVQITKNGRTLRAQENITSLEPAMTLRRAENKPAVRDLLASSCIAVPRCIVIGVDEFDKAVRMLEVSPHPLVVKPAEATSGGAGVTTNVTTVPQLGAAVAWACGFNPRILVEEQLTGDCYRVLVMDGEVLDIVMRQPPTVLGDGVSTISRLIRLENRLRRREGATRAQCLIGYDPDLRNTLTRQGLSLRSRPARGDVVILKQVINDNCIRDNLPANNRLCSAILEAACKAAQLVGVRLAGIDIICGDPTVPLDVSGGAIIEINAAPGLYYHYNRDTLEDTPIADRVLNRAFNLAATDQGTKPSGAYV